MVMQDGPTCALEEPYEQRITEASPLVEAKRLGFRGSVLAGVTAENAAAVAQELLSRALGGDLKAARMLLDYTVGKPRVCYEFDQDSYESLVEAQTAEACPTAPATGSNGVFPTAPPANGVPEVWPREPNGVFLATPLTNGVANGVPEARPPRPNGVFSAGPPANGFFESAALSPLGFTRAEGVGGRARDAPGPR